MHTVVDGLVAIYNYRCRNFAYTTALIAMLAAGK